MCCLGGSHGIRRRIVIVAFDSGLSWPDQRSLVSAARDRLTSYLESAGWSAPPPGYAGPTGELWSHPDTDYRMPIPFILADEGLDWDMLIQRLAMLENRPASAVLVSVNGEPPVTWSHPVTEHMNCPDDGDLDGDGLCWHRVDIDAIRASARNYLAAFGPGDWTREVELLKQQRPGDIADIELMSRYICLVRPEAIMALLDALEQARSHG